MSQSQTQRSSRVDLLHGSILKSLLLFALPIMASRVFQQIYNTMDTLIVGHTLGDSSIAAMGACSSIYEMMTGFTFGVGNGLAIVTARCFGRQETERMKKSVASCIVIGITVTLVVTVLATIFMHPLLRLLKTPAEILEESYSYISILSVFLFVMFAYNLCSGLLGAIGNSFMPLVFLIISSLVNIVLDLLFIRSFGMGVVRNRPVCCVRKTVFFTDNLCFIPYKKVKRQGTHHDRNQYDDEKRNDYSRP